MQPTMDQQARKELTRLAAPGRPASGRRKIRRTSSRFCLGVEHGDYNGTELFGVGTDRFIWLAYRPNGTDRIRMFSGNFAQDGVVEFQPGRVPPPKSAASPTPGALPVRRGLHPPARRLQTDKASTPCSGANIPGGGMSRSASLTINLMLTALEVNGRPDQGRPAGGGPGAGGGERFTSARPAASSTRS